MSDEDFAPVVPTLEFEALMQQFVASAEDMVNSQSRMRDLIRLNNDLTSNLDLPTVLRRIVEIGVELIPARYGAMGVIGDEHRLEQFIHVGMDDATVTSIDHLPEGKGLLGALIDEPYPVRLPTLSVDSRSSGFPAHHPPMNSFLGVPIRVRDQVFGNLYLTDSHHGEFSADDEELAQALAATAGIAIENARLFEDAEYRARWSSALVDVSRRLMQAEDGDELDTLIERLCTVAKADLVSIALVTPDGGAVAIDRATGLGAEHLMTLSFPLKKSLLATILAAGEPAIIADLRLLPATGYDLQENISSTMLIPFTTGDATSGVLCVARTIDKPAFEPRDLDMGVSFASHVSLTLDRSHARVTRRRMELLEDRSRIARDLHDHVIQRLFATGLNLQATAAGADPVTAAKILDQIREIDGTIAQIRQTIFAIRRDPESTSSRLRGRVMEIVDRTADQIPNRPRVTFTGPVDLLADAALTDDVAAVVTESLANAVRHAQAQHIDVTISAVAGRISVEVCDDGVGPGDMPRLSGLANLRDRATERNGTFDLQRVDSGGTRVTWSVPV